MFTALFFVFSIFLCVQSASLIKTGLIKQDIIHDNFPVINLPYVSDLLVVFQIAVFALTSNLKILEEFFLIMGVIQVMRTVCTISTVLPPLKNNHDNYRFGGLNGSGTEYIFSGHASYSAVTTLYLYDRNIIPLYILIIYNTLTQFLIILNRNHYTVDVVLAWIITPLVYERITR